MNHFLLRSSSFRFLRYVAASLGSLSLTIREIIMVHVLSKGVKNIRIISLDFYDSHSATTDRTDRRFECHNHGFESGFICKTGNCNTDLFTAKGRFCAGRNENRNVIVFLSYKFLTALLPI